MKKVCIDQVNCLQVNMVATGALSLLSLAQRNICKKGLLLYTNTVQSIKFCATVTIIRLSGVYIYYLFIFKVEKPSGQ